jgi:hypothetical protein
MRSHQLRLSLRQYIYENAMEITYTYLDFPEALFHDVS